MCLTKRSSDDTMDMFEVRAKCGHVGKSYFIEKSFAIEANSAKEAAAIVRCIPRVKHHHSDAIRYVEKIDEARFKEIKQINSGDPYFQCRNVQEQKAKCSLELFSENEDDDYFISNEAFKEYSPKYYGKKKLRNPKKYLNNYLYEERFAV